MNKFCWILVFIFKKDFSSKTLQSDVADALEGCQSPNENISCRVFEHSFEHSCLFVGFKFLLWDAVQNL